MRRACRGGWMKCHACPPMDQSLPPGLYIVATPIGNLGDMTARAAETLCRVDCILAEDKRVTAKLLAHIGAKAPMTAYHDHSDEEMRRASSPSSATRRSRWSATPERR